MGVATFVLVGGLLLAQAGAGFPPLRGPYLGQNLPGSEPVLFAPGIVNQGLPTRDMTFSPDGRECYFTVMLPGFTRAAILGSRVEGQQWSAPEVAPFARDPRYRTLEPAFAPDGQRLYFVSDRPADAKVEKPGPMGIWVMERRGTGWGEPRRLGSEINGGGEAFFPSLTRHGTLYFTREEAGGLSSIWRARPQGQGFGAPERLPAQVNAGKSRFNAFVDPDEGWLIVPTFGAKEGLGGTDYWIVFRDEADRWSEPQNLGPAINSPGNEEYSASLSPDGKYLFFMSARAASETLSPGPLSLQALKAQYQRSGANGQAAVWWVEAAFLRSFRSKAVWMKP